MDSKNPTYPIMFIKEKNCSKGPRVLKVVKWVKYAKDEKLRFLGSI